MKKCRSMLAWLLVLLLCAGLFPAAAFAEEAVTPEESMLVPEELPAEEELLVPQELPVETGEELPEEGEQEPLPEPAGEPPYVPDPGISTPEVIERLEYLRLNRFKEGDNYYKGHYISEYEGRRSYAYVRDAAKFLFGSFPCDVAGLADRTVHNGWLLLKNPPSNLQLEPGDIIEIRGSLSHSALVYGNTGGNITVTDAYGGSYRCDIHWGGTVYGEAGNTNLQALLDNYGGDNVYVWKRPNMQQPLPAVITLSTESLSLDVDSNPSADVTVGLEGGLPSNYKLNYIPSFHNEKIYEHEFLPAAGDNQEILRIKALKAGSAAMRIQLLELPGETLLAEKTLNIEITSSVPRLKVSSESISINTAQNPAAELTVEILGNIDEWKLYCLGSCNAYQLASGEMDLSGGRKIQRNKVLGTAPGTGVIMIFLYDMGNNLLDSKNIFVEVSGEAVPGLPISDDNFPDLEFRKYLAGFDLDSDCYLSDSERSAVTAVDVKNNAALKSILGIEHFQNLTEIDCSGTGIPFILLSSNPGLLKLNCSGCPLSSLDVSALTELQYLDCSNTGLESLSLAGMAKLQSLNCSNNKLSSLSLTDCTALENLDCGENKLCSLDVSACSIKTLNTAGNLFMLPVEGRLLSELQGFDESKMTLLSGAELDNGYLRFTGDSTRASYSYDVGGGLSAEFSFGRETPLSYTVSYDANGGSGAPENQIKYQGSYLKLSETQPQRRDYQFLGWAGSADAQSPEYLPGDIYKADAELQLFALWKKIDFSSGQWIKDERGLRYVTAEGFSPSDCWMELEGKLYRFDSEGYAYLGFYDEDGFRYYLGNDGAMRTGFQDIEGKRYFFDSEGHMQYGWLLEGGHYYYFGEDGVMLTGRHEINGSTYYFYEDGVMATDVWIGTERYSEGGNLYTNCWMGEYPYWWYQLADGNYLHDCFMTIDGEVYYFQSNGYVAMGFYEHRGNSYYFDENTGAMYTGWLSYGDIYYYFDESTGVMYTGRHEINGSTYYFYEDGVMASDVWIEGERYSPDGHLYTNCWMGEEPYWWYQLSDGSHYKDCFMTIDGCSYYFGPDGYVQLGWFEYEGNWYYFHEQSGMMQSGWMDIDGYWYYFDAEGRMYKDRTAEIDGVSYSFDSQGHII